MSENLVFFLPSTSFDAHSPDVSNVALVHFFAVSVTSSRNKIFLIMPLVSLQFNNVYISTLYNITHVRQSSYKEGYKKWHTCHFFVLPGIDSLY